MYCLYRPTHCTACTADRTATYLQRVDLLVRERALHGAVRDAEAVGRLLCFRVGELVDQLHLLYQVTPDATHLGKSVKKCATSAKNVKL